MTDRRPQTRAARVSEAAETANAQSYRRVWRRRGASGWWAQADEGAGPRTHKVRFPPPDAPPELRLGRSVERQRAAEHAEKHNAERPHVRGGVQAVAVACCARLAAPTGGERLLLPEVENLGRHVVLRREGSRERERERGGAGGEWAKRAG